MDVAWAMDFFTEEVWTAGALVTFYSLFLIYLKNTPFSYRRLHTLSDSAWVKQQARNCSMLLDDIDEKCRYVIHDRDNSFSGFDFILKAQGIKIVKTPPKAPMRNAFTERFVHEARQTLNQITPLG